MKKQFLSLVLALSLTATAAINVPGNILQVRAAETTTAEDTVIKNISCFKNGYSFRSYIDNADTNGAFTIQETITENWNGTGGVHEFTAPQSGTLIYYTFSNDGHVEGNVYGDFALTKKLSSGHHKSTRENAVELTVKKGSKYYLRQERWNGTGNITATTYLGLIPSSPSASCVTPKTIYNKEGNVEVKSVSSITEFKSALPSMKGTETRVANAWSGTSEVHSLSVGKTGWLLVYGYKADGYLNLKVYSDKALGSILANTTQKTLSEDPVAVWVEPGTYYFYSERWNGFEDLEIPQVSYFGFIAAENYLTASAPVLNKDKTGGTVTFHTKTAGSIRVMPGYPEPSIIDSDKFWQVDTRANMLQNNKTFKASSNGAYVARFQDNATKMYFMVPFTVSGISSKKASAPAKPIIKSAKNISGRKIKVVLKKKVGGAKGYEISYAANRKFTKAVSKKFKTTSIVLKNLKKKNNYYIRVRAYNASGKGKWSAVKKVFIKK